MHANVPQTSIEEGSHGPTHSSYDRSRIYWDFCNCFGWEMWLDLDSINLGRVCHEQVSRAGTNNYTPQYVWGVITCPCPWYLLLANASSINFSLWSINMLSNDLFVGNVNMYFQFIALLHTEVDIIPHGKQGIIYIMVSKTWLLMIWWNMNPDLQQPLCWLVLTKCPSNVKIEQDYALKLITYWQTLKS